VGGSKADAREIEPMHRMVMRAALDDTRKSICMVVLLFWVSPNICLVMLAKPSA
jgi:hypothetical protein